MLIVSTSFLKILKLFTDNCSLFLVVQEGSFLLSLKFYVKCQENFVYIIKEMKIPKVLTSGK